MEIYNINKLKKYIPISYFLEGLNSYSIVKIVLKKSDYEFINDFKVDISYSDKSQIKLCLTNIDISKWMSSPHREENNIILYNCELYTTESDSNFIYLDIRCDYWVNTILDRYPDIVSTIRNVHIDMLLNK